MSVTLKVIEFCPDAKGPCLGGGCAAFRDTFVVSINEPLSFITTVTGKSIVVEPLVFSLQVNCCERYQMFIDKESLDLFLDFNELFRSEDVRETCPLDGT